MNRIKLNRNGSQTRYNLHRVHRAEVLSRKLGAIIIYSAFTGQSCPLRRRERCQEAFLRRHGNEQIELVYKVPIEGALAMAKCENRGTELLFHPRIDQSELLH